VILCRGIKFRDEDDAYEYFKQRELDEANDPILPAVLPQPDAQQLAQPAPDLHVEAAGENDD
jgi:hypothetical protein